MQIFNMMQLIPTIPVEVEGYGPGEAHVLINYGLDIEPTWIVFIDESGESLQVKNHALKKCT